MTDTGIDQHHWLFQEFALRTAELNLNRFGVVWGTASPIIAEATVTRFVSLHTGAVLVFKTNSFHGLLCSDTFFSFLIRWLFIFTRSHHAKSRLLYHLTLLISVGNTGRKAHSTASGTSAPFCCLLDTIGT